MRHFPKILTVFLAFFSAGMPLAQGVAVNDRRMRNNSRPLVPSLRKQRDGLAGRMSMTKRGIIGNPATLNIPRRFPGTYTNPILPSPSADPWVINHKGIYYYCESRHQASIHIRKARHLTEISKDEGVCVWTAPANGNNSNAVWAPELHFINGRWYIYFAADDGKNENHRMWVLESTSDDPLGPYVECGQLETDGWAIDGTVLTTDDNKLYFVWSGWPGKVNGQQNIYIAPMSNPWTVSGKRVLICQPEHKWETVEMAIAEGPQILKRNGMIFIVYSASGSWTVDYCLGLLVNRGGDVMDPASWEKHGPVLQKTNEVWGVGHCSFVRSPDQTEDWIVYHAKSRKKHGWQDRHILAQRFTWTPEGLPNFGTPLPCGISLPAPSCDI